MHNAYSGLAVRRFCSCVTYSHAKHQATTIIVWNRYYVDVAACDVQAVLENTHMEDIDITRLPLLASSHGDDSLELPATPQPADRG